MVSPRCTHGIPPMYSWYPPDVLITPDVLNIPRRTEHTLYRVGTKFVWSSEHQKEFDDIKSVIWSPDVILYHPDWSKPFQVQTDASRFGIGAYLHKNITVPFALSGSLHVHLITPNHAGRLCIKNCMQLNGGWNNLGPMFLGNILK